MTRIRKMLCAAIAGLALALPLTATPQASANPNHSQTRYYRVYYRDCSDSPWSYYGAYRNHRDAHKVAEWIRSQGYQTFVS